MCKRDGMPIWIEAATEQGLALQRLDLKKQEETSPYGEAWLQQLLHAQPGILPLEQIEPGFGDAVSLCREHPLAFGGGRTGTLDNLFVTPDGGLVLVEAKLWRNPEARRSAVAQAMEYAAAVFALGYGGRCSCRRCSID
jgi:hypothetical protein